MSGEERARTAVERAEAAVDASLAGPAGTEGQRSLAKAYRVAEVAWQRLADVAGDPMLALAARWAASSARERAGRLERQLADAAGRGA